MIRVSEIHIVFKSWMAASADHDDVVRRQKAPAILRRKKLPPTVCSRNGGFVSWRKL